MKRDDRELLPSRNTSPILDLIVATTPTAPVSPRPADPGRTFAQPYDQKNVDTSPLCGVRGQTESSIFLHLHSPPPRRATSTSKHLLYASLPRLLSTGLSPVPVSVLLNHKSRQLCSCYISHLSPRAHCLKHQHVRNTNYHSTSSSNIDQTGSLCLLPMK